MAQKKKLQVFVSSTYTDLTKERQAAVEAILTAGHIPAGMELFAAGDESQMNAIRRWIDESDAFLLILGGRYGSIEPKSQKSYIHLEYEYALEQGKPLFAVVIEKDHLDEKVKKFGIAVIERDYPQKLEEFRELVQTKMVRSWRDPRDIKLAILETMAEFSRRSELVGWIPGDQAINARLLAEEIAQLAKENAALRKQVEKIEILYDIGTVLNRAKEMHSKAKTGIAAILSVDFPSMGYRPAAAIAHQKYFAETLDRGIPTTRIIDLIQIQLDDIVKHLNEHWDRLTSERSNYRVLLCTRPISDMMIVDDDSAALFQLPVPSGRCIFIGSEDKSFVSTLRESYEALLTSRDIERIPVDYYKEGFDETKMRKWLRRQVSLSGVPITPEEFLPLS